MPFPLPGIFTALALAAVSLLMPALVGAQTAEPDLQQDLDACRKLAEQDRRLACYDSLPGAIVTGGHADAQIDNDQALADDLPDLSELPTHRSPMMRDWELDDATHAGLLRVRTYRPAYLLPVRYTTRRNNFPSSPAPGRTVTESENLDAVEAKMQISFKTKLLDDPIFNNGDLWFGYTQQSSWQAYNGVESSPFRENNFEPEVFSTWRTGVDLFGLRWQFMSLGFVHQSNGLSEPRSRSWNRIYANFGFERGDWRLFIRPWLRIETASDDDNPDIEDFLGNGDLRLKWRKNKHDLGLLARWVPGENRGALQFDWHYPLLGDLKAYMQVFTGYGETLIDYNHRQTTIGFGVSIVQ
ncbi:MAG: phospholipase A [Wenzhouxiangellaceae bacterium]|nr:phospholipase A [Wenzhouxiangellaceae bacterium]